MVSSSEKSVSRNLSEQFPVLYQNRYCDQEEFSIALFSSENHYKSVRFNKPFLLSNFNTKDYLPNAFETTSCIDKKILNETKFKSVGNGADIYFYNQQLSDDTQYYSRRYSVSVSMYSSATKSWKNLPVINDEHSTYDMCSFMQKLFLFGLKFSPLFSGNRKHCMFYDKKVNS